jgi:hypothetical protein
VVRCGVATERRGALRVRAGVSLLRQRAPGDAKTAEHPSHKQRPQAYATQYEDDHPHEPGPLRSYAPPEGSQRAQSTVMASYSVNERSIERARRLIEGRQYVLDSDWGDVQPKAADQNAFLASHSWDEYAEWHLGLTDGAPDETKARYAFVYGDFRRLHRTGLIACHYRAAEWRHKEIELAAHDLLQLLDNASA